MFTVFNPLFLALSRAMRTNDESQKDGWELMLDRREYADGELSQSVPPVIGAPIYMPQPRPEHSRSSN